MEQKLIKSMTGYKATDLNMCCKAHKFELGVWYEVTGDLKLCGNGFHFCDQPTGPWSHYNITKSRLFRIEAEDVLDMEPGAGSVDKWVCRRIKLVVEIRMRGRGNTGLANWGDNNTGDQNKGRFNSGNRNVGDSNTGARNAGDRNSGSLNKGDANTGHENLGACNTGNSNRGNYNTGNRNCGDYNTGRCNVGDYNSGSGNVTSYCQGFFCTEPQTVKCFDVETGLTRSELYRRFRITALLKALTEDTPIDFNIYKDIPGITPEKLKALHKAHISAR